MFLKRFFSLIAPVLVGAFLLMPFFARAQTLEEVRCVCETPVTATCDSMFSSSQFIVCGDLNAHAELSGCRPVTVGTPAGTFDCPGAGNVDTWLPAAQAQEAAAAEAQVAAGRGGVGDGRSYLQNPLGGRTVPQIIGRIIAWFGTAAGALFMLYLLWGGAEWMTARGDQAQAQKGRQRIVAASAGIVIVLLSYVLVSSIVNVVGTATR